MQIFGQRFILCAKHYVSRNETAIKEILQKYSVIVF